VLSVGFVLVYGERRGGRGEAGYEGHLGSMVGRERSLSIERVRSQQVDCEPTRDANSHSPRSISRSLFLHNWRMTGRRTESGIQPASTALYPSCMMESMALRMMGRGNDKTVRATWCF
jgi:hypothetical protein